MPPHPLELLAVYRDLTADERRLVDTHLTGCGECRATLAAYRAQDSALRALPQIRPQRLTAPPFGAKGPVAGGSLRAVSGAFALAGLAALVGFVILRVQAPSAVAAAPGLTLPPTVVHLPSPWLPALPWMSGSFLLVGLLLIFSRRSPWPAVAASGVLALLLTGFVPPISSAPNLAAAYWRLTGGYGYDPRLPFRNNFLIGGRPEAQLRPYLDQLIGQVGLTPLDPNQPLASYEILRVSLHPAHNRVALVTTRFVYADGSSRIYPVPLVNPFSDWHGFLLGGWQDDGLERLRSQHLAFPGQPFANADAPIRLGPARRLDLNPAASRLDEADPAGWLWQSVRLQRLVWSTDGQAFLCVIELDSGVRQLWWVPTDGSPPQTVGAPGNIREYGFSPDSRTVVYTQVDPEALAANPSKPIAILAAEPGSRTAPRTLATLLFDDHLPGITASGAWFAAPDGKLWIAPFDGSPPHLAGLSAPPGDWLSLPRPAPDGSLVAFGCGTRLCLQDLATGRLARVDLSNPTDMTWSPDGTRLAVVTRDVNNLRPVSLHILDRQGDVLMERDIAPRDVTDPPQWTADGGAVFVQTFPQDGRRIIALDLASGQVIDLSQEHWDAYFALSPDGQTLLLNNGRGDFWLADVLRSP